MEGEKLIAEPSGGACRGSCLRSFPTCWSSNSPSESQFPSVYVCVFLDECLCEDQYDFHAWEARMFLESQDIFMGMSKG